MSELYGEMLAEAEKRILFYSEEWKNFLPSDPGNTILEILTWFQAMQREKLREIPEEAIENLLRMAGFVRKTEKEALLYVKPETKEDPISIVKNQKFYAGHLCFEAEEEILQFQGSLLGIYRRKNQSLEEILELKDSVPVHTEIFGAHPKKGDQIYLLFDALPDLGEVFSVVLYVDVWQEAPRNPFLTQSPFASLSLDIHNGTEFVPLSFEDDTYAFLQSGEIRFQCPKDKARLGLFGNQRGYLVRVTLGMAEYDLPPSVTAIYGPLLRLRQRDTKIFCRQENVAAVSPQWERYINLGTLYGYDDQEFDVSELGKIDGGSLRMWAGKDAFEIPPESETLFYEYDRKKQVIRIINAGDYEGEMAGISAVAVTEGASGNIRKNNRLQTVCKGREVFFCNPIAGKGGRDYESLEQMKKRFFDDLRTPQAAVTEKDCAELAKKVPGLCIQKTQAYVTEDACIHVVVLPYGRGGYPVLSDRYQKRICNYLEERKLLNTEIVVQSPKYLKVDVRVKAVRSRRGRGEEKEAEVQKAIEKLIDCRLNEKNIGSPIIYGEILEGVKTIPRIAGVRELEISAHSTIRQEMYAKEAIVLPPGVMAVSGKILVDLSG